MNEKKFENDNIKQEKAWTFKWSVFAKDYELKVPTDENPDNVVSIKKGQIFDGGLTLKNIHHNGYRMAYDIGVIALWVYPKAGAVNSEGKLYKPYKLVLGYKDFEQVNDDYTPLSADFRAEKKTKNDALTSQNDPGSLANFNTYKKSIEHVVTASWKSRKKLFGDDSYHLYITQKYVLTDYNDTPAHEPTGGIFAARMHPMTKIYYENRNDGYLESVRVDYRLHLNLDTYPNRDKKGGPSGLGGGTADVFSRKQTTDVLNNHVGLFRDEDGVSPGFPANRAVFESSEKPLIAEIVGKGIIRGSNIESIESNTYDDFFGNRQTDRKVQNTWDNIHWWGAGGNIHASAPGAFHALHVHWKWADILQEKDSLPDFLTGVKYEGEPQFKGQSKGGILTDSRIQNQSIRFAIVKKENLPNTKYFEHSTENFDDFFLNLNTEPSKIGVEPNEGANLVLYYSAEVFQNQQEQEINESLIGNVFLHGIFFAHQDERSPWVNVGNQFSYYTNPSNPNEKEWKRNPQK